MTYLNFLSIFFATHTVAAYNLKLFEEQSQNRELIGKLIYDAAELIPNLQEKFLNHLEERKKFFDDLAEEVKNLPNGEKPATLTSLKMVDIFNHLITKTKEDKSGYYLNIEIFKSGKKDSYSAKDFLLKSNKDKNFDGNFSQVSSENTYIIAMQNEFLSFAFKNLPNSDEQRAKIKELYSQFDLGQNRQEDMLSIYKLPLPKSLQEKFGEYVDVYNSGFAFGGSRTLGTDKEYQPHDGSSFPIKIFGIPDKNFTTHSLMAIYNHHTQGFVPQDDWFVNQVNELSKFFQPITQVDELKPGNILLIRRFNDEKRIDNSIGTTGQMALIYKIEGDIITTIEFNREMSENLEGVGFRERNISNLDNGSKAFFLSLTEEALPKMEHNHTNLLQRAEKVYKDSSSPEEIFKYWVDVYNDLYKVSGDSHENPAE